MQPPQASQSPSAWLASAPSPAVPGPVPIPSRSSSGRLLHHPLTAPLPAAPPPAAAAAAAHSLAPSASAAAPHSADPATDARRALALLLGPAAPSLDPSAAPEGLLDRVQREVESLLDAYDRAYADRKPLMVDSAAARALDSLSALVALLARSAPGGFVPSPPTDDSPATSLSQAHLDRANDRAQSLYREGVRLRENAEVVRAKLS